MRKLLFILLLIFPLLLTAGETDISFRGKPMKADLASGETMISLVNADWNVYQMILIAGTQDTIKFDAWKELSYSGWLTVDYWISPRSATAATDSLSLYGYGVDDWNYRVKNDTVVVFTHFDFDSTYYSTTRGYRDVVELDGWTSDVSLIWEYVSETATDTLDVFIQLR